MKLIPIERAVLEMLLAGDHPALAVLREQLATAQVSKRDFSGVGFWLEFKVDALASRVSGDFEIGDVQADIDELEHGVGFALFVRDGFIKALEGYTYDEPWPPTVREFSLRYLEPQRKAELQKLDHVLN